MLAHAEAHEVFQEMKKQGKVKGKFGIKIDGVSASPDLQTASFLQ